MEGFLGVTKGQKIDNVSAASFLTNLLDDINDQSLEFLPFLLGPRYLNLGVWDSHRKINRKIRAYEKWCTSTMRKKIKECEASLDENKNYDKKPEDLIEAMLLENKKNGEAFYG